MSDRIESLKRIYKGMSEHARKMGAEGLKQRYAKRPTPPAAPPAPAEPQASDDDMAALSEGLE